MEDKERIQAIIEVLFDESAREDERDDAVMVLGRMGDEDVLKVLISMASDPDEDFVAPSAGQSAGKIWTRLNAFNIDDYWKLIPEARTEAFAVIKTNKPEWLERYKLTD